MGIECERWCLTILLLRGGVSGIENRLSFRSRSATGTYSLADEQPVAPGENHATLPCINTLHPPRIQRLDHRFASLCSQRYAHAVLAPGVDADGGALFVVGEDLNDALAHEDAELQRFVNGLPVLSLIVGRFARVSKR